MFCLYAKQELEFNKMELSHSLTLNEEALAQISPAKRPVFIFKWLQFLDKVLIAAQKVSITTFSNTAKI